MAVLELKATGLVILRSVLLELPARACPSRRRGRWQDPWCSPQRPDGSSFAFGLGSEGAEPLPLAQGSGPALLPPQIYEVVRPLVSLLHLQRTGLENFEGLMALTNLAGISERLR